MKRAIIFSLLAILALAVFVSAQEGSYPREFTLTIGEEIDFPDQDIKVELRDITTNNGISGYIANIEVTSEPSYESSIFGLWMDDNVGYIYSKKTKQSWEIKLIDMNLEKATFKIDFPSKPQTEVSCIQSCKRQMVENCATFPNSPLCPDDISRKCELNCQSEFTLLNEDFVLDIGQTIKVKDHNNMEIELLSMERECTKEGTMKLIGSKGEHKAGDILKVCNQKKITSHLRIKKDNEEISLDLTDRESKKVFDVRIDAISYVAVAYPVDDPKYEEFWGSSEPQSGIFGIYEKGFSGFWSRISSWFKKFFGGN